METCWMDYDRESETYRYSISLNMPLCSIPQFVYNYCMNWYGIVLTVHIIGALVVGLYLIQQVTRSIMGRLSHPGTAAARLAYGTLVQILSGCTLALVAPGPVSGISFCSKMGVYLVIISAAEYFLFHCAKRNTTAFPLALVGNSLFFSALLSVTTGTFLL